MSALYSQNAMKTNARSTATTMERLSTGVRVNSAKDDAAGLAIGQNMTSQIRGLDLLLYFIGRMIILYDVAILLNVSIICINSSLVSFPTFNSSRYFFSMFTMELSI